MIRRILMVAALLLTVVGCFGRETIQRHQNRAAKSQALADSYLRQVVDANRRGILEVTDIDQPLTLETSASIKTIADMLMEYVGPPAKPLKDWQGAPALIEKLRQAKTLAETDAKKANEEARKRDEELKKMSGEFALLQNEVGPLREQHAETVAQLKKYEGMVRIPWIVTLSALGVVSAAGLFWFGITAWFRHSRSMSQAIGLAAIGIACAIFGGMATTWWYFNGMFVIQWAYAVLFFLLIGGGIYLAVVSGALKTIVRGAQSGMNKMPDDSGAILKGAFDEHQSATAKAIVRSVRNSEGLRSEPSG